jgi:hypothetical protein
LKRFLFNYDIESASGTQTFYVDAETMEEAKERIKTGGEVYADDCEVTELSKEPDRNRFLQLYTGPGVGAPRNDASYVVKVRGRFYWPRVSALVLVSATRGLFMNADAVLECPGCSRTCQPNLEGGFNQGDSCPYDDCPSNIDAPTEKSATI